MKKKRYFKLLTNCIIGTVGAIGIRLADVYIENDLPIVISIIVGSLILIVINEIIFNKIIKS